MSFTTPPAIRAMLASLALLSASAGAGHADGLIQEMKVGVLAHDVPNLWSGFGVEDAPVAINVEALLAPSMPMFGGTLRPAIGGSIAVGGEGTSSGYVDARWQYETPSGIFFGLGLGVAVHDGQTDLVNLDEKALGSRVLFHIPVEIGMRIDAHNSVSAYFEHMSNAYTQDYNEGLDRLGIRYGYKF